jgi:uncharacterized protein (TIGR03435 family)
MAKRSMHSSMNLLSAALISLVAAAPTHAQILHATAPLPSFEVATIRPWQPAPTPPLPPGAPVRMPVKIAPGTGVHGQVSDQVHFIGQASLLIALAYNLRIGTEGTHIVGMPAWADSESCRYKIDAKIDSSLFSTMQTMSNAKQHEQVQLMEQSLLAERFNLRVHFETRMLPAYSMVVAKGGSKLTPARPGETLWLTATTTANGTQVTARAATLDDWIDSPFLGGREVVNKTGLEGAYDFTLTYSPRAEAVADDSAAAPVLTTAIEDQLGLKLVPAKAPVEVIIIDHIERPTEN